MLSNLPIIQFLAHTPSLPKLSIQFTPIMLAIIIASPLVEQTCTSTLQTVHRSVIAVFSECQLLPVARAKRLTKPWI